MPDYIRLVSYIYNYEEGIKRNNVGYARVEARNGQCKCTLHIAAPSLNEKQLKAYIFKRTEGGIEGILLGTLQVKNGVGDYKTTTDSLHIMNSPYGINDMGGIILYFTDRKFYATEWDDRPITSELVALLEEKPEDKRISQEQVEKTEQDFGQSNRQQKEIRYPEIIPCPENGSMPEEGEIPESGPMPKEREMPESEPIPEERRMPESGPMPEEREMPESRPMPEDREMPENEPMPEERRMPESGPMPEEREMPESEPMPEEREMPESGPMPEERRMPESGSMPEERRMPENSSMPRYRGNQIDRVLPDNEEINNYRDYINCREDTDMRKNQENAAGQNVTAENTDKLVFEEHPLAKRIFKSFPRMYPFEDNDVAWCVKIEPQDIGLFPMEAWVLGNNSFLLHGYYSYRHLIFAKINERNGVNYIIGVPGVYHNREKFMAKMFGFENFKCVKRKDLKTGEFGYWYIPIVLR